MIKDYHDIQVSKRTFSRLLAYSQEDESDDDVIVRLLNQVEGQQKELEIRKGRNNNAMS